VRSTSLAKPDKVETGGLRTLRSGHTTLAPASVARLALRVGETLGRQPSLDRS
jgi:hypothetical protein